MNQDKKKLTTIYGVQLNQCLQRNIIYNSKCMPLKVSQSNNLSFLNPYFSDSEKMRVSKHEVVIGRK